MSSTSVDHAAAPDGFENLLQRAKGGSRTAAAELVDDYQQSLSQAARQLIDRKLCIADPSDLVQLTKIEAIEGIGRFRGSSPFEFAAWLRSILRNNAVDTRRLPAYRRIPNGGQPDVLTRLLSLTDKTPSSQIRAKETSTLLADALGSLTDEHRAVIELRHFEHLPFEEVGARLDRSAAAARALWVRALQHLRRRLRKSV